MIYAKNRAAMTYCGIHPNLDLALEHITPEFLSTVTGERKELKGNDVYVTRFTYETLPESECFYEAHRSYLDIHLMLTGSERVDIASPDTLMLFESRPESDFYAYHGDGDYHLTLCPGDFLVVFPDDAHKIKMQADGPQTVSKVVFKVCIH